jgi:hypothetical protein
MRWQVRRLTQVVESILIDGGTEVGQVVQWDSVVLRSLLCVLTYVAASGFPSRVALIKSFVHRRFLLELKTKVRDHRNYTKEFNHY